MLRTCTKCICALVYLLFSACSNVPDKPVSLPITDLARGAYSDFQTERIQVVNNAVTLEKLWQKSLTTRPLPAIDFTQKSVVLAAMGEKPSGGYRIDVSRVEQTANGLLVTVTISKPGDACVVSQILTQPYHFATIPSPAVGQAIEFSVREKTVQCGQ